MAHMNCEDGELCVCHIGKSKTAQRKTNIAKTKGPQKKGFEMGSNVIDEKSSDDSEIKVETVRQLRDRKSEKTRPPEANKTKLKDKEKLNQGTNPVRNIQGAANKRKIEHIDKERKKQQDNPVKKKRITSRGLFDTKGKTKNKTVKMADVSDAKQNLMGLKYSSQRSLQKDIVSDIEQNVGNKKDSSESTELCANTLSEEEIKSTPPNQLFRSTHRTRWTDRLLQIDITDATDCLNDVNNMVTDTLTNNAKINQSGTHTAHSPISEIWPANLIDSELHSEPLDEGTSDLVEEDSLLEDDQQIEDDEDDELPQIFTPNKLSRSFTKDDIVWVKWKKYPHLPALVRNVYKKRKRLSLEMFYPPDCTREDQRFNVGYGNINNIVHYNNPRKPEFLREVYTTEDEHAKGFYKKCLESVEHYIDNNVEKYRQLEEENDLDLSADLFSDSPAPSFPACSTELHSTPVHSSPSDSTSIHSTPSHSTTMKSSASNSKLASPISPHSSPARSTIGSSTRRKLPKKVVNKLVGNVATKRTCAGKVSNMRKQNGVRKGNVVRKQNGAKKSKREVFITKVVPGPCGLSKRGQERLVKMKEKNEPFVKFLVSPVCQTYLRDIFQGTVSSELHQRYTKGSNSDRSGMKHRGFGPLDDDDQIFSSPEHELLKIDVVLNAYTHLLSEMNQDPVVWLHYIFDVWIPEAMVFALKKLKSYSGKKAWEMFHKGVRRTKEEHQLLHREMKNAI